MNIKRLFIILGFSALISFTIILALTGLIVFVSLLFNGFWIKSFLVGFVGLTIIIVLGFLINSIGERFFNKE